MSGVSYLVRHPRKPRKRKKPNSALLGCPQKRAICLKARIMKPKKPNSAQRKVARVRLSSTKKALTVAIPGHGHSIQQYSVVLVRFGRVRDLPGVRYKVIRGVYDAVGVVERGQRRSKFGTRKKRLI